MSRPVQKWIGCIKLKWFKQLRDSFMIWPHWNRKPIKIHTAHACKFVAPQRQQQPICCSSHDLLAIYLFCPVVGNVRGARIKSKITGIGIRSDRVCGFCVYAVFMVFRVAIERGSKASIKVHSSSSLGVCYSKEYRRHISCEWKEIWYSHTHILEPASLNHNMPMYLLLILAPRSCHNHP